MLIEQHLWTSNYPVPPDSSLAEAMRTARRSSQRCTTRFMCSSRIGTVHARRPIPQSLGIRQLFAAQKNVVGNSSLISDPAPYTNPIKSDVKLSEAKGAFAHPYGGVGRNHMMQMGCCARLLLCSVTVPRLDLLISSCGVLASARLVRPSFGFYGTIPASRQHGSCAPRPR
jgi:hypothetical protein